MSERGQQYPFFRIHGIGRAVLVVPLFFPVFSIRVAFSQHICELFIFYFRLGVTIFFIFPVSAMSGVFREV